MGSILDDRLGEKLKHQSTSRPVLRISGPTTSAVTDQFAVEAPLEIRVDGEPFAVTMRTPGDDRSLVLGFLVGEGIVSTLDSIGSASHCGSADVDGHHNVFEVKSAPGRPLILPGDLIARRGTLTTSSCGVCGRQRIDDLIESFTRADDVSTMSHGSLISAVAHLRDRQPLFEMTGGCHAASLVGLSGEPWVTFEDVGRHNAVDKVIGALFLSEALPARSGALIVSGRVSFEVVQKALRAGISIVAGVSAATSLAVDVALRCNLTLAVFARDENLVITTGKHRITD